MRSIKIMVFLSIILVSILFSTKSACACSCANINIDEAIDNQPFAFSGKILQVIGEPFGNGLTKTKIVVEVIHNYSKENIYEIMTVTTSGPSGSSCGYDFSGLEEQEVFIIGYKEENGAVITSYCHFYFINENNIHNVYYQNTYYQQLDLNYLNEKIHPLPLLDVPSEKDSKGESGLLIGLGILSVEIIAFLFFVLRRKTE